MSVPLELSENYTVDSALIGAPKRIALKRATPYRFTLRFSKPFTQFRQYIRFCGKLDCEKRCLVRLSATGAQVIMVFEQPTSEYYLGAKIMEIWPGNVAVILDKIELETEMQL